MNGLWFRGRVLVGLWVDGEWGYLGGNSIVLLIVVKCVGVMGIRGEELD